MFETSIDYLKQVLIPGKWKKPKYSAAFCDVRLSLEKARFVQTYREGEKRKLVNEDKKGILTVRKVWYFQFYLVFAVCVDFGSLALLCELE